MGNRGNLTASAGAEANFVFVQIIVITRYNIYYFLIIKARPSWQALFYNNNNLYTVFYLTLLACVLPSNTPNIGLNHAFGIVCMTFPFVVVPSFQAGLLFGVAPGQRHLLAALKPKTLNPKRYVRPTCKKAGRHAGLSARDAKNSVADVCGWLASVVCGWLPEVCLL